MPKIGYADPPAGDGDASEPAPKEWGIAVTPYLWLTGFDFTANGLGLERSVSDVASMANGVFMFNAGLRWRRLYTAVDGIFVDFGNDSQVGDRLDIYAGLKLEMYTLKAGVKVLDTTSRQEGSGWRLFANAGARYWDMEPTFSYTYHPILPGQEDESGSGSLSEQWWDPILGAAGLWLASRTVQFEFSGHVGGFGIGNSSTFTWDLNGLASFIVWRHIALHAGYRVLETDRTTGEGDTEINTKLHMNGLIVGASFFY
jgi:hypothetical protein